MGQKLIYLKAILMARSNGVTMVVKIPINEIDLLPSRDRMIYHLYFVEILSQTQVAKILKISVKTVQTTFRKRGWRGRKTGGKIVHLDEEEIRVLYFEKGLTYDEIAEKKGLETTKPIMRIFKNRGWTPRIDRRGTKKRKFRNEEERKAARVAFSRDTMQRIKDLRAHLFGTCCRICGAESTDKSLSIHRKDGTEHKEDALWRIGSLKSLVLDEWVPLCVSCHRGVHWLMDSRGMNWGHIEEYLDKQQKSTICNLPSIPLPGNDTPSSETYERIKQDAKGSIQKIRQMMFGSSCCDCGIPHGTRRLVVHRKDGRLHSKRLLSSVKYLRTLNPEEWSLLCQKCHRYFHWTMDILGMNWRDLEKSGALGEI